MSFIETSALDSNNVDTAFENVLGDVYSILNTIQQQQQQQINQLKSGNTKPQTGNNKPDTTQLSGGTVKITGKSSNTKADSKCC